MEGSFEGPAPVCVQPFLNPIENQQGKGIFWIFLIKESFTWSLCSVRKPKPVRQSGRKPNSSSSVAPGATSPSLAFFNGHADLRPESLSGAGILAPKELKYMEKHAVELGACCELGLWVLARRKRRTRSEPRDGAGFAAEVTEEPTSSCRLVSFFGVLCKV